VPKPAQARKCHLKHIPHKKNDLVTFLASDLPIHHGGVQFLVLGRAALILTDTDLPVGPVDQVGSGVCGYTT
jgi:hypothetical protein